MVSVNLGVGRAGLRVMAAALLVTTAIIPPGISQAQSTSTQMTARTFTISAGPLAQALIGFGEQAGIHVSYVPALASGVRTSGVSGQYTTQEALARLLAGTGITPRFSSNRSVTLVSGAAGNPAVPADGSLLLETIQVDGRVRGIPNGWDGSGDTVFTTPGAVAHISRETLEDYTSTSASDMLRSQPGVLSGESRNSGGLDVNIRGLQGQGRAPVTVDGAMNATAVYRGYQGIANRSFVDPDFIGGVSIEKGPSTSPGGAGAIGGAVNMTTIKADDIVAPGQSIGIRVKAESGTNTTPLTGIAKANLAQPYNSVMNTTQAIERPGFLEPTSGSASVVLATKSENFDLVAGFARRRTGNYHTGANGSSKPDKTSPAAICFTVPAACSSYHEWYKPGLTAYLPGEEVLNTSQNSYSGLLKGTFRFADDHTLDLGYSHMKNEYGETYPMGFWNNTQTRTQGLPSEVKVNSYTSRYRWDPESELIDLKWNAWATALDELSSSADGSVNLSAKQAHMWGTDLSNTSSFASRFGDVSMQYGLSYQSEETAPTTGASRTLGSPREGERQETSVFTNAKWNPYGWLQVEGGTRYHTYKSKNTAPGNTDDDASDDALDLSARLTVMPMDGVQIFGGYKEASRLPSLFESAGGFMTLIDDNLKPERAKDWEFGANYQKDGVFTEDDTLGLKLAYFDNTIDDYINRRWDIVRVEYYPGYFYNVNNMVVGNIAKAKFSGLELSGSYQIGSLTADFSGTYYTNVEYCRTDDTCKNSSLAADYATNYVPPEYSLNLSLSQKFLDDRLTLGGRMTHVSARAAAAEPTQAGASPFIAPITWDPYTIFDVFANYKINNYLTARLSVENLTDLYYVDPLNLALLPSPGRTIKFGLTGQFSPGDTTGDGSGGLDGLLHFADGRAFDWSGIYVGGNASILNGGAKAADFQEVRSGLSPQPPRDRTLDEFTGRAAGLQAGYNHQFGKHFVAGIEGDFSWADLGYNSDLYNGRWDQYGFEADTNWMASIKLRGGVALDRLFIYGTAGLAVADVDAAYVYTTKTSTSSVTDIYGDKQRLSGWTVGAGIEYALTRNWTLKGEYNLVSLEKGTFKNQSESFGSTVTRTWRNDLDLDSVRVGVNYKF